MKKITILLFNLLFVVYAFTQNDVGKDKTTEQTDEYQVVYPTEIKVANGFAITKPLNKITLTGDEIDLRNKKKSPFYGREKRAVTKEWEELDYSKIYEDVEQQLEFGEVELSSKVQIYNYAGQKSGSYPPDCNGDVGPEHYFQVVNSTYAIYQKSDGALVANGNLNSIFDGGLAGAECNDGDPIVLWDEQAQRWFYSEFALCGANDLMLIAVSTTADPTGTWYSWSFDVDDMPDYMKYGIWQDGYYMATNTSDAGRNDVYVFERDAMIAGDPTPTMLGFDNPSRPATFDGFHAIMPLDNDGAWAPAGTPGTFITVADDNQGNSADELRIYELDVDWVTPSNSTFSMVQTLGVNSFTGRYDNPDWENVPQPGTPQQLDGVSTVLMYRAQYRNFSGTEKIVCAHGIAETGTEAAIRWYELERNGGTWSIAQQGTYNPGGANDVSRWMPVIAMNGVGQIAIGFNISSPTNNTYPGMHVIGRSSCAPANTLDIAEFSIVEGGNSQTGADRWSDYSNMSVDPIDDYTFWYTSEYMNNDGETKHSRIAAFTLNVECTNTPSISGVASDIVYKDRGKSVTITGDNLLGCEVDLGGYYGFITSYSKTELVVTIPPGNYSSNTLTVTNTSSSNTATYTMDVRKRNLIPVVYGSDITSDDHPTILSAVTGLHAWYGTTAFDNSGTDYLAGTKTINVEAGIYTDEVVLNPELNPVSGNELIIQNNTGDVVTVDATGNDYGFNLSTVNYVTLTGFTVHSALNANIYAQGDNVTINKNKTYGSTGNASQVGTPGGSGIQLETGTPFTVTNNLSYDNFKHGIEVGSSNNIIKNNTTDNNGAEVVHREGVILLNEQFDNDANWNLDSWGVESVGTTGSISGDPVAYLTDGTSTMISNPIDVTGYTAISIKTYYRSYGTLESQDDLTGQYSFNGTDWTNLFSVTDDVASWATSNVTNITPSSNTLYIQYIGNIDASKFWVIDDIEVKANENFTDFFQGAGLYVDGGTGLTVENNIFIAKSGNDKYYTLQTANGGSVTADYNLYYTTNSYLFNFNTSDANTKPGTNDIASVSPDNSADPLFIGSGDYHIQSEYGSNRNTSWPPSISGGTWVNDLATSPALDAGNSDDYSNEPANNGDVINQGCYGNTAQASKSQQTCTPPTTQAHTFTAGTITNNSLQLQWTRGNGTSVLVVIREGEPVNTDPVSGTPYSADNTLPFTGSEIGTGNYVVYNSTGNTVTVEGLSSSTTYHFAIYEYFTADNCYFLDELTGNLTTYGIPTITTTAASSVTASTASSGGNVTSINGATLTAKGVCWSTSAAPTIPTPSSTDDIAQGTGTGSFTSSITGLTEGTTYHVRAYATNSYGTSYGDDLTFTTLKNAPTVQAHDIVLTPAATSISATWTNGNGDKRIVVVNTTNSFTNPVDGTDPTANTVYGGSGEQVVFNGTGNSVNVTGLSMATEYWFRVYEYNNSGTDTKYYTVTATDNPKNTTTLSDPCAGFAIPYSEDFDSGNEACWDGTTGTDDWLHVTPTTAHDGYCFLTNGNNNYTNSSYILTSPSIDFLGYESIVSPV